MSRIVNIVLKSPSQSLFRKVYLSSMGTGPTGRFKSTRNRPDVQSIPKKPNEKDVSTFSSRMRLYKEAITQLEMQYKDVTPEQAKSVLNIVVKDLAICQVDRDYHKQYSDKMIERYKIRLANLKEKFIKDDGLRVLRTHVELLEAVYLTMSPIPTTNEAYKNEISKRMKEFKDPVVFEDDFKIEIDWQPSMDAELKDAIERKVSKHFRTWLWLVYTVDVEEVKNIRKDLEYDWSKIRTFASGVARLYVYASVDIRRIGDYSKRELNEFTLKLIKSTSLYLAAELILKNTWKDN